MSKLESATEIDCLSLNSNIQKHVASGSQTGTLFYNDVENTKCIWSVKFGDHSDEGIGALQFHSLHQHVLFVALGSRVLQLDTRAPAQLKNNSLANPVCELFVTNEEVSSLSVCPEGQILAAGDDEGLIHIWNLNSNQKRMHFSAHDNICSSVCISPYCENEVFSGGMDCSVKSWDLDTGTTFWEETMSVMEGNELPMNPPMVHQVTCPESSAWTGLVAAARGDCCILLRLETPDDEDNEPVLLYDEINGHTFSVSCINFAKNSQGEKLISAGNDRKLILWDWMCETSVIKWERTLSDKANALVTRSISENTEEVFIGTESGVYVVKIGLI
eukprot:g7124.t1